MGPIWFTHQVLKDTSQTDMGAYWIVMERGDDEKS